MKKMFKKLISILCLCSIFSFLFPHFSFATTDEDIVNMNMNINEILSIAEKNELKIDFNGKALNNDNLKSINKENLVNLINKANIMQDHLRTQYNNSK